MKRSSAMMRPRRPHTAASTKRGALTPRISTRGGRPRPISMAEAVNGASLALDGLGQRGEIFRAVGALLPGQQRNRLLVVEIAERRRTARLHRLLLASVDVARPIGLEAHVARLPDRLGLGR